MGDKELLEAIGRMLDERDERLSAMMDEKLKPIQGEIQGLQDEMQGLQGEIQGVQGEIRGVQDEMRDMRKDIRDLKAGQKNMIKRLAKIEAVQEYLIEHVDDLEQRNPA